MSLSSGWLIFRRQVVRDVLRHKLLVLLNIASVALGIAVYVAIQIAMHSANRSFAAGIDLVAGKANLEVRGAVPDELLPLIKRQRQIQAATPVVEGFLTIPERPGEYLQVLGIDVFSNEPFRTFDLGREFDPETWLGQSDAIAVTEEFARLHGLRVGDKLKVVANAVTREVTVRFLMRLRDAPAGANIRFAAMDIGWAQELFGMRGTLSSIQLLLKDPKEIEAAAVELRKVLPAGLRIEPPGKRTLQVQKMISAFQLNLTALSLVSLLVGMFLIFNSISASVARRQSEIGILRALGASANFVRWLFLGEALLFAAIGAALGIGAGVFIGNGLLGSVGKTLSSLYLVVSLDRFYIHPLHVLTALLFGGLAALVAAWRPAAEAARVDPIAAITLRQKQTAHNRDSGFWITCSLAGFLLGAIFAWGALQSSYAWLSFCTAFCTLAGCACLAQPATLWIGKVIGQMGSPTGVSLSDSACHSQTGSSSQGTPLCLVSPYFQGVGVIIRLGAQNLWRSLGRNAMTVAALTSAVAMMTAVAVMIFSFRKSVDSWVDQGMVADIYIAPAANEIIGLVSFLPQEVLTFFESLPTVDGVETFRETQVDFLAETDEPGSSALSAISVTKKRKFRFVGGEDDRKMAALLSGQPLVVVTESFARKQNVKEGEILRLGTPSGWLPVRVIGIYVDYSRDAGLITMDAGLFAKHWKDQRIQSMAIHLKDAALAGAVEEGFRTRFGRAGEFAIYSNSELRKRVLDIFDQTFAVTNTLRVIAVVVAVIGLFLSVTTLVVERRREIGLLRSVGASHAQVKALFLWEAVLIALIAAVLGIFGGMLLAWVLTEVVNRAFFGWTIELSWPTASLMWTPAWIMLVGLVAAWLPSKAAGSLPIASSVRSE